MLCVIVRISDWLFVRLLIFIRLRVYIHLFTHSYVNQAARVNLVLINENDDDDGDDLDFFARVWVMAIGRLGLSHVPVTGAKVNANCVSLCYTTICGVICIGADLHRAMVATGPAVRHRACFFVQKSTFVLRKITKTAATRAALFDLQHAPNRLSAGTSLQIPLEKLTDPVAVFRGLLLK